LRLNNRINFKIMKNLLLVVIFFSSIFSSIAQDNKINWMSLEDAVEAQSKEPRKIIMDMYTTWCGPCKLLDKNTFQNPDVATYINKNYYAVKFNAEGNTDVTFKEKTYSNPNFDPSKKGRNSQHELAGSFGVNAYPTIVFIDENGGLIAPIPGYKAPNQLEIFLKLFATNKYKEVTTKELWEQYQREFQPSFKI
jgi:thioredoxin-related protein